MSFHTDQYITDSKHVLDKRTKAADQRPTYGLVCVGFGTASLAIAASMADDKTTGSVLFLEKEERFTWNSESLLPEKPVGTSFLQDLTTMQNPRSAFTFMSYLHSTGQIVGYANNSKLAPSRRQMGKYFSWAASSIQQLGWVQYGQEALRIVPVKIGRRVVRWAVHIRNTRTNDVSEVEVSDMRGISDDLWTSLLTCHRPEE